MEATLPVPLTPSSPLPVSVSLFSLSAKKLKFFILTKASSPSFLPGIVLPELRLSSQTFSS